MLLRGPRCCYRCVRSGFLETASRQQPSLCGDVRQLNRIDLILGRGFLFKGASTKARMIPSGPSCLHGKPAILRLLFDDFHEGDFEVEIFARHFMIHVERCLSIFYFDDLDGERPPVRALHVDRFA